MKDVKKLPYPDNLFKDLVDHSYGNDDINFLFDLKTESRKKTIACILLDVLSKNESNMMTQRYEYSFTLKEIGELYNLSPERIRQMINVNLRKIATSKDAIRIAHQTSDAFDNPHSEIGMAFHVYFHVDMQARAIIDTITPLSIIERYDLIMNNKFVRSLLLNGVKPTLLSVKDNYEFKSMNDINKDMLIVELLDSVLTVREHNILRRAKIIYVSDLINMTKKQLMSVKYIGKKTAESIIEKVENLGYRFKDNESIIS